MLLGQEVNVVCDSSGDGDQKYKSERQKVTGVCDYSGKGDQKQMSLTKEVTGLCYHNVLINLSEAIYIIPETSNYNEKLTYGRCSS